MLKNLLIGLFRRFYNLSPPQTTARDVSFLTFLPRRLVWTAGRLGSLAHRLASFLLCRRPRPMPIFLPVLLPSSPLPSSPSPTSTLLRRILTDLCLPLELATEVLTTFEEFTLQSCRVLAYPSMERATHFYQNSSSPGSSRAWALHSLPSPLRRLLALTIIVLKFLCGLDDQTEVVWRHNLGLLAGHRAPAAPHFCLVTWLRLSKLRLAHLATLCPALRHQYRALLPASAPPLALDTVIAEMRTRDATTTKNTNPGPPGTTITSSLLASTATLLAPFAREEVVRPPVPASTSPLAAATSFLLDSPSPRVAEAVARLEAMSQAGLAVYAGLASAGGPEAEVWRPAQTWAASVCKFAELRGGGEEVRAWRRARVPDAGNRQYKKYVFEKPKRARKEEQRQNNMVEVSELKPLAGEEGLVRLESRAEALGELYRQFWATDRTHHPVPRPQVTTRHTTFDTLPLTHHFPLSAVLLSEMTQAY